MSLDRDHQRQLQQADRISKVIDAVGGVMRAAELIGVSRGALFKWKKGEARLPLDECAVLAEAAGVSVDWIATGRESAAALVEAAVLDRYDVLFSGELRLAETEWPRVPFFRDLLERRGAHIESTIALVVDGREMEPAIREGAIVAVDRSRAGLDIAGVYAFVRGGRMMLMRSEPRLDGSVILSADSRPGDRQEVPAERVAQLGVVGMVMAVLSEP